MDYARTEETLEDVLAERVRQDRKWGEQNHPDGTGGLSAEAAAMQAKDLNDRAVTGGFLTWRHILEEEVAEAFAESDAAKLRAELVQVAAVATAWVEAIDRRGK